MSASRNRSVVVFSTGLLIVQILDIVVHIAAGEVEVLRFTASALLAVVAIVGFVNVPGMVRLWVAVGAGVTYIAMNAAFVAVFGLVNPATDSIRTPLFAFVLASLLLLVLSTRASARNS